MVRNRNSRLTSAMRQELISRNQLSERLVEFGWMPNDSVLDLGEDFIVHVYLENRATGVVFHVQEKSVTNLYDRRNASGDELIYRFEVKDLKHWEAFDPPIVVLLVWDIELREGRWVFVDTAIADLDKRLPNWRNNETKTSVHIPWVNSTDDAGLTKLKQQIGHRWYSLISKNRQVEMKVRLRFPNDEEGKKSYDAYDKYVREGSEVTFVGHTIESLEFSDWWGKWFGDYDPEKVVLTASSSGSREIMPVSIVIVGNNGSTASLSNIELKNVQSGTEVATVTNTHQRYPIHFNFTFSNPSVDEQNRMSFQLNSWGGDAYEALNLFKFLYGLMSGGRLDITFLDREGERYSLIVPPHSTIPPQEELQFFQQICRIQDKSGQIIKVPFDVISREDARAINELMQIFEYGRTNTKGNVLTVSANRKMLELMLGKFENESNPISLQLIIPDSFVKLFGYEVKTGRMVKTVNGQVNMSPADIQGLLDSLGEGESAQVKIIEAEIVEEFPEILEKLESPLAHCLEGEKQ